jgi:hypothetical protein
MAEFKTFLTRVIKILNQLKIGYVVVGGVAAIIKGRIRSTTDIDIIIERDLDKLNRFFDLLAKNEFDVLSEQINYALNEGYRISIFDKKSIMRIDLKIVKTPDEQEVLEQASIEEYAGLKIRIASIEHILYGKILYIGSIDGLKDEELLEFNDISDFLILYNQYKSEIDQNWLTEKIRQKNLLPTYKRLVAFPLEKVE